MTHRPKKIILFDIDGTLLLTGGAGAMAFNLVFKSLHGIEYAWRDIHPDGRTDPSLIEELYEKNLGRLPTNAEMRATIQAYGKAMKEALTRSKNFRLMPGIVELLNFLHEEKVGLMGLATGNFEETAYQKLQHAGLKDYFHFGGFGSDHHDRFMLTGVAVERGRKLAGGVIPEKNIFLVGDSVHDVKCGRRLGIVTVAVNTGSTPKQELAAAKPDYLVESFSPLEKVARIFN